MTDRRVSPIILLISVVLLAAYAAPAQALLPRQDGDQSGTATSDSRRPLERPSLAVQSLDAAASTASHPLGRPFVIRAEAEREVYPAVAYNTQWQEYLVVFWNDRPGCDVIGAQRVSRTGTLLGARWIAAGCPAEHRHPDVAYNVRRNEYLIVWMEESGGNSLIQAQSFTADLIPPGTVQTLIAGPIGMYTSANPAVAYAYTSDKYLVVWELELNPPVSPATVSSIAGHMVLGNGTKDGSSFNISLDSGGSPRRQPDVAYNRHANRYLVVWQQWAGALWDIHGQQVHGGGGFYLGDITIAWYTKSCTAPVVAAIPTSPTTDTFLVAWEVLYIPPNDRDIYGRLVAESGTPGADFWISWANAQDESSPAIAGDELAKRYMVVWRHPQGTIDIPIRGRAISYAGALLGQEAEFSGAAADRPAVASGPAGDFLVAWQDQPVFATDTNIYGQFWGNRMCLPLLLRRYH